MNKPRAYVSGCTIIEIWKQRFGNDVELLSSYTILTTEGEVLELLEYRLKTVHVLLLIIEARASRLRGR